MLVVDVVTALFAFAAGACIGSFLNVCIARWPQEQSVVSPRSRCPGCQTPIAWRDNVPLVSWLRLRGRCRSCGEPISVVYPAVELVVAIGWLLAFVGFGPTLDALRVAVFGTLLFGVAATDARHYVIPDGFTVFGLFWVLGTSVLAHPGGAGAPFVGPYDAFIGACAGAGAIAIIGWLGEVALKKEAMGFGDVTLMAVVGAAVGAERALLTVVVGAFLGAVLFIAVVLPIARLRRGQTVEQLELPLAAGGESSEPPLVPFGVFLAPAALLTLLWGDAMIAWYLSQVLPQ